MYQFFLIIPSCLMKLPTYMCGYLPGLSLCTTPGDTIDMMVHTDRACGTLGCHGNSGQERGISEAPGQPPSISCSHGHDGIDFPLCSCQPRGLTIDYQDLLGRKRFPPPQWYQNLPLPSFLSPNTVVIASILEI